MTLCQTGYISRLMLLCFAAAVSMPHESMQCRTHTPSTSSLEATKTQFGFPSHVLSSTQFRASAFTN